MLSITAMTFLHPHTKQKIPVILNISKYKYTIELIGCFFSETRISDVNNIQITQISCTYIYFI